MSPNVNVRNLPGFGIPEFDSVDLNYVGSTNNLDTVVYKKASSTVATLAFTYIGGAPAADDAKIDTITRS